MLQLLRSRITKYAPVLHEVFGQVQFFQQDICHLLVKSSIEEYFYFVGLEKGFNKGSIIDFFILDPIVDGPSSKQPLQEENDLINATSFNLQLDEPLSSSSGYFYEDVNRLDCD